MSGKGTKRVGVHLIAHTHTSPRPIQNASPPPPRNSTSLLSIHENIYLREFCNLRLTFMSQLPLGDVLVLGMDVWEPKINENIQLHAHIFDDSQYHNKSRLRFCEQQDLGKS